MRVVFRFGEIRSDLPFRPKDCHASKRQPKAIGLLLVQPSFGKQGRNHPKARTSGTNWGPRYKWRQTSVPR